MSTKQAKKGEILIEVPAMGESIVEARVSRWLKKPGDRVAMDEPIVELETDKAAMELPAPRAGILVRILAEEGEDVLVGAPLAAMLPEAVLPEAVPNAVLPEAVPNAVPEAPSQAAAQTSPASRKAMAERGLDAQAVAGAGPGGRIRKADVPSGGAALPEAAPQGVVPHDVPHDVPQALRGEERVRMSPLRRAIARRLKEAQNTAAMLTTMNDVDMSAILALRRDQGEAFERRHGVRLGFMGFFIKACVAALEDVPALNARVEDDTIVYSRHCDLAIAVGGGRGLVTPVLRDVGQASFAAIERSVADFGRRARDGTIRLEELQGGTFTVTNGGVYGSLLSTPILNPPQSGVLGVHRIEERPVAREGAVVIRPMMYLALTYDHRVVDGREAVTFLVRVKECLEAPARLAIGA